MKKKSENTKRETESGLNTDLGSACSKVAFRHAKNTFKNRKGRSGRLLPTVDGGYASLLDINGQRIGISSDGIGTKIEIAERMGIYSTLGYDLVAMTIDDLVCNGYEPAFLSNILDVDRLDIEIVDELMQGLQDAATTSNIVVTGGEIAELGKRIGGFGSRMHFNWCATGIGVLHPNLSEPITGKQIQPGDAVISVYSPGFRSNGFSLLRKILSKKYGAAWHLAEYEASGISWGEAALTPCLLYSPLIVSILDKSLPIRGIAHITGGGVVDNLGRLLKVNKLGARLDNLFSPDSSMSRLIELGKVQMSYAFRYLNMNNGMLLVVPQSDAARILTAINRNKKYKAKNAGSITSERRITIRHEDENYTYTAFENK
jgi:phosphoribosylformylglycinamidine cyclo-ligase